MNELRRDDAIGPDWPAVADRAETTLLLIANTPVNADAPGSQRIQGIIAKYAAESDRIMERVLPEGYRFGRALAAITDDTKDEGIGELLHLPAGDWNKEQT